MNHEIKFRVWDGSRMHHPKEPFSSNYGPWHLNLNGLCYFDGVLQDVTFLQYTGQKDANGTEIYEGDVLRGRGEWSGREEIDVVEWSEFGWLPFVGFGWERENMWNPMLAKVLGNVYENPELIEQQPA